MILVAFRHGLRSSELVELRGGIKSISPTPCYTYAGPSRGRRPRIRLSATRCGPRKLRRERDPKSPFTSERGSPFTTAGSARMVERASVAFRLILTCCATPVAFRWIRGRCRRPRSSQHPAHAVVQELSPGRFKDFWRRRTWSGLNTGLKQGREKRETGASGLLDLDQCRTSIGCLGIAHLSDAANERSRA